MGGQMVLLPCRSARRGVAGMEAFIECCEERGLPVHDLLREATADLRRQLGIHKARQAAESGEALPAREGEIR